MSATSEIQLQSNTSLRPTTERPLELLSQTPNNNEGSTNQPTNAANIATAIPDGGYGWVVVLSCSLITFWFNGLSESWGVIQTALLRSSLSSTPTSTIAWVGSLALGLAVGCSLIFVRLTNIIGARMTAVLGVSILAVGEITSGFTVTSVGGLFATAGVLIGIGMSICYGISNSVPAQYFSAHLGLANGLVKLGGGIGATVFAVSADALIRRVGISWMFRTLGLITFVTGLPAAMLIKERSPVRNAPFINFSMFRSVPFLTVFLSSMIGTFTLFIPPYFLPLYAQAAGLSSSTGAALVAGFNGCTAIGRLGSGYICDRLGPLNTYLFFMLLNGLSMLSIWPVSNSLSPLIVFAILNGFSNGAFFTTLPTVIAKLTRPEQAAIAMSMNITGWTAGYLLGAPIAGYLLQAAGSEHKESIAACRPAIFYAGGLALASSLFILVARLEVNRNLAKRL